MKRRRLLGLPAVAALAALAAGAARANVAPPEVLGELQQPQLQGSARLRFLGLQVYDARLWTLGPVSATQWAGEPLALELQYLRRLNGRAIAERSLKEMERQGEIAKAKAERWLAQMLQLFPDVSAGDRITGVHRPGEGARFFLNGTLKGEVRDEEFSRWFFGIWLAPQTSEPAMRQQLLGNGR